jgi:hypothetical protein
VTVFGASALQARQDAKKVLDNYREPLLAASLDHLEDAGRKRLSKLQQLLVELVRQLDDQQKRYPFELKRPGLEPVRDECPSATICGASRGDQ